MWEFTVKRCDQCGVNLSRKKPTDVIEVKAHPGEPDIEEWSYAPCPSCGSAIPVSCESEPETPEPTSED